MTDHDEKPEPPAFDAGIRSHRELMEQMADREHYDFDPMWMRAGRRIGVFLVYLVVIGAIVAAVAYLVINA